VDVIAHDIKNIEEESSFDDAYDREKWRDFVMAAMALNEPISWRRRRSSYCSQ